MMNFHSPLKASFEFDLLAAVLANEYPYHDDVEFQNLFNLIRIHLDTPNWELIISPDGALEGWVGWFRTDDLGAWLIRSYGFDNLIRLAIPLSMCGPVVLMMYTVVFPQAPSNTLFKLYQRMVYCNRDAESVQTCVRPKGKKSFWYNRRIRSF